MKRRSPSFREDYLLVVTHWFTILNNLLTEQIKRLCHSFSLHKTEFFERCLFSMAIHSLIITEDLRQVFRIFVSHCPLKVSRIKLRSLRFVSLSWNGLRFLIYNLSFLLFNNWLIKNFPFFLNINCLFNAKLQADYTSNLTNVFLNCEKFVHRS